MQFSPSSLFVAGVRSKVKQRPKCFIEHTKAKNKKKPRITRHTIHTETRRGYFVQFRRNTVSLSHFDHDKNFNTGSVVRCTILWRSCMRHAYDFSFPKETRNVLF